MQVAQTGERDAGRDTRLLKTDKNGLAPIAETGKRASFLQNASKLIHTRKMQMNIIDV